MKKKIIYLLEYIPIESMRRKEGNIVRDIFYIKKEFGLDAVLKSEKEYLPMLETYCKHSSIPLKNLEEDKDLNTFLDLMLFERENPHKKSIAYVLDKNDSGVIGDLLLKSGKFEVYVHGLEEVVEN